jgi:pSer/pThr/pTyr-binding forkhead associated (FHA) protein
MWILRWKPESGGSETTFRLTAGGIKTLGRATRADFILDAPLVSRLHCRFTAGEDGTLEVEDLRSTNGTFVNGERVKRSKVGRGDRVKVGRVELQVDEGQADTAGGGQ